VEDIGKLIFRLVALCADTAPDPARELVARVCAFLFYIFSPGKRKNVAENVSRTGHPVTRDLVSGIFRLQTKNIIELFASSRWKDAEIVSWFEFEGRDALDRTLAEGKGAVLVTGHIGSWELGARYFQALGYSLHVVAGVQMNKLLTGAVKEAKEKRGIHVINPENSYRKLLKALASNSTVALLVDGNIYTGGREMLIFGAKARVPDGPVRLAKASGAPIIGVYCRRLGNRRFKMHLEEIVSAREIETIPEGEALVRVYGAVGRFIEQNVDQWCLFRRLWEGAS
jgi:KDO2-lipid IV(A) lauroyltransferase